MSCGEIDIQFPFGLKGANKGRRCSYPRFQLSCDKQNQTILKLSDSGDLVVKSINYEDQTIKVNDPDGCLPKRFLENLSLSVSPPFMFDASVYGFYDLTFFRCPYNVTKTYPVPSISCISDNSSSVIFSLWSRPIDTSPWHECEVMSSALVPIPNSIMETSPFFSPDLNNDIELKWNKPTCGDCAARGQVCGFKGDTTTLQVGCLSSPKK
ncbi:putative RING-H2 finger protein ATL21A [Gastrolobium bilobum]|uniref:putative RING-H2 finger protein ATL21A n=1 Tax=Gastrolobium bilobum TaxID=150636 RepID=UPI002AB13936|nr:putative RING-H2 finger protein ATL21A [Gastrolobium bilobum]